MEEAREQNQASGEKWARLYVDQSEASARAIRLLRNSHYRVITFRVSGSMGPELRLGRNIYRGLKEISTVVTSIG